MEKLKNIGEEFKTFAIKGNAVEMAVGIVIGAAFGKIVSSFVSDIITPIIGIITGGVDLTDKVIVIKQATEEAAAITINYGMFLTTVIDFLIVAWAIFIVVKAINTLKDKAEKEDCGDEKEEEGKKPSDEVKLLTEIRDSLNR